MLGGPVGFLKALRQIGQLEWNWSDSCKLQPRKKGRKQGKTGKTENRENSE